MVDIDSAALHRILNVISGDVLPLTAAGVAGGNKIFGAAILRADDLSLVVAGTNAEVEAPIWHGEMDAIRAFYALAPDARPAPQDCFFVATHEPCSLCLSGITWSGFTQFGYLFSHQDSAAAFSIPHDIRILRAVYAVPDPDRDAVGAGRPLYNRHNEFFTATDLAAAIDGTADEVLHTQWNDLQQRYAELSGSYQNTKGDKGIPLP